MGLYRAVDKKMIAGVLAGVSEKYNWDVSVVRLAAVFATVFTGLWPGIITYVVAAVIIPEKAKVSL